MCVCACVNISVPTCSLILLMPSGPSRLTACLTRSVRPQLSIRNPRSCRNFASVDAASSFLVVQKQSSALLNKSSMFVYLLFNTFTTSLYIVPYFHIHISFIYNIISLTETITKLSKKTTTTTTTTHTETVINLASFHLLPWKKKP